MTASVVIEIDLIGPNGKARGKKITKVYTFDSREAADEFQDRINNRNQAPDKDDYYGAYYVEETVSASTDDDIHVLSVLSYERLNDGSLKLYMQEELVFVTSEIESFRKAGLHPSIVSAYDNPEVLEPVTLAPEEIEGITGNYYFGDNDPEEVIYLSFNPDVASILHTKHPQETSRFSATGE